MDTIPEASFDYAPPRSRLSTHPSASFEYAPLDSARGAVLGRYIACISLPERNLSRTLAGVEGSGIRVIYCLHFARGAKYESSLGCT